MRLQLRSASWRVRVLAVLIVATALPVGAQRPARDPRRPAAGTAARATVVRAELAGVLLQSGRYAEAAREFRQLLARNPDSFEYRLGLARALAWGNRPREAERELSILAARRPASAVVDTLLRAAREAFEPRATEAAEWVASDPLHAPYRLALARALARERLPRLAIVHFDTLLMRAGPTSEPDRRMLLREIADVYEAARDWTGGAARLREELALAPADTALRHDLAALLAGGRRYGDAGAQYDTLLAVVPAAAIYLERARVRLALGDPRAAESDLTASLGVEPSAGAYLMLADLYRDRGDHRAAEAMYRAGRARATDSEEQAIALALAQLAREQRPAALAPTVGRDPGWHLSEQAAADNAGVAYSALELGRTLVVAPRTSLTIGALYRQLAERASGRSFDASGYGGRGGVSYELARGVLLARAAVEGGFIQHPLVGTLAERSASVAAWVGAWELAVESSRLPAYPTLFTTASLRPPGGGPPIMEQNAAATLAGPLGPLDLGVSWQRSRLSDGNERLTVQGYGRVPLAPNLFALYSGTAISFDERSALYWDPERYVGQGAGIEYAVRRTRGLSLAARLLPGFAWSTEAPLIAPSAVLGAPPVRGPLEERSAFQLGGSGDLAYRSDRWEVSGALGYGRGRTGDYQRVSASLAARLLP